MNGNQIATLDSSSLVIGCLGILLALILIQVYSTFNRRKKIGTVAEDLGLTAYRSSKDLISKAGFDISNIISSHGLMRGMNIRFEVSNLMYAENDGLTLCIFDYKYGSDPKSLFLFRRCQTVVAIISPDLDTQWFDLSLSGILEGGFYEDFAITLSNSQKRKVGSN